MKGPIPLTGMMILESEESQWRLLTRKIINQINVSALIERSPGHTVRIRLVITKIIPPEDLRGSNNCKAETNLGAKVTNGMARSKEFLNDLFDKQMWLLMGYIEGEEKKPILITHYDLEKISLKSFTIYSQKLNSEEIANFLPYSGAGLN